MKKKEKKRKERGKITFRHLKKKVIICTIMEAAKRMYIAWIQLTERTLKFCLSVSAFTNHSISFDPNALATSERGTFS